MPNQHDDSLHGVLKHQQGILPLLYTGVTIQRTRLPRRCSQWPRNLKEATGSWVLHDQSLDAEQNRNAGNKNPDRVTVVAMSHQVRKMTAFIRGRSNGFL